MKTCPLFVSVRCLRYFTFYCFITPMYLKMLSIRKQNSLWADGDVFREKVLRERDNGKMTRILSGVDDITINGCNKNKSPMKEEQEQVSLL